MPAPLPWATALAQMERCQGGGGLAEENRAKRPKNGRGERRQDAERLSRRLPTAADVLEAAHHRLRNWSPEQVAAGLEEVDAMLPDLDPGRLTIRDRRDPWTAACALAVLHADAAGDGVLFWAAGCQVLAGHQQATRASTKRQGDDLDRRILAYLVELPGIQPAAIWADLLRIAEEGGDDVVDAFDQAAGRLKYQAKPGNPDLSHIRYEAFRLRVQRLRKAHRLLAPDAPVAEDGDTEAHRRAA